MTQPFRLLLVLMLAIAPATRVALAQPPAPAWRFRTRSDRAARSGSTRSRHTPADSGRTGTGQRGVEAVRRQRQVIRPAAAEEVRAADAAPAGRLNIAATFTQTNQRMGPRHEGFVATAKQGNIDLLLHGDSITDWWLQEANKPVFDKYFGNIRTANFAVAGDTTQGVLWGLRNGEGQGFQPKAVMLMIGTNNTGTFTAPEIAEGVGAVVLELRRDFPDAKILLLAIFPRGVPGDPVRDKIAEVNRIVAKLDDQQHVFYMDIGIPLTS